MRCWVLCALAAAPALLGCSKPDSHLIATVDDRSDDMTMPMYEVRAPMRTLPWVSDFRLGTNPDTTGRLTQLKKEFSPDEPIYLSMQVNDVPRRTIVTSYWYGPSNLTLGHETQTISSGQARLRFVRSDTRAWQPGAYRVEVWIGDDKIGAQNFDIVVPDPGSS
jgi:hypothetical protein